MRLTGIQAAAIAVFGVLVSLGAFWLSTAGSGLPAALALLLAGAAAPIALGIAISAASQRGDHGGRHGVYSPGPRLGRFRRGRATDPTRCTGCGSQRELSGTVLVCAHCDLTPAAN